MYTKAHAKVFQIRASEAERRASEIADAISWIDNKPATGATSGKSGDNQGGDDDDSVLCYDMEESEAEDDEIPDLMTMIKQKREENARLEEGAKDSDTMGNPIHVAHDTANDDLSSNEKMLRRSQIGRAHVSTPVTQ